MVMSSEVGSSADEDIRVTHTRTSVKKALLALLAEHHPDEISISGLCKAAGVSRPTFYQHFGTIDDVYAAVVRDRLQAEQRHLVPRPGESGEVSLLRILEHVQTHRDELLDAIDSQRMFPRARAVALDWLGEHVAQAVHGTPLTELSLEDHSRVVFAVGGLASVLAERMLDPASQNDAETIADVLRASMAAVLRPPA